MISYHNPALVSDAQVGQHHRLLSTEDLDKPLPEGAEFWNEVKEAWEPALYVGNLPRERATYRIPLSLSDKIRRELQDKYDLLRVVEAVEQGAEFEIDVSGNGSGRWAAPAASELKYYFADGKLLQPIRLKPTQPTPSSIPWTLETHPDVACVKHKQHESITERLITRWSEHGGYLDGFGWVNYSELHSDWLQRSGDPAGQKVTV